MGTNLVVVNSTGAAPLGDVNARTGALLFSGPLVKVTFHLNKTLSTPSFYCLELA